MLTVYAATGRGLQPIAVESGEKPESAVWIDLMCPTAEEEAMVQGWFGIEVPTREEMREIEVSSRLYEEDGALFMTILSILNADAPHADATDVTFILLPSALVTVRYAQPRPITLYAQRAGKAGPSCKAPDYVLLGLVETFVDRLADILERTGADIDTISREIFEHESKRPIRPADFKAIVARIGRSGELAAKVRESLVTIARMMSFLSSGAGEVRLSKEVRTHIKTATRDCAQLGDHATYLSNKTMFLLEATMGLINIEQTNIIKIFSVAAVALLPPTLIASIYGMNFTHMPELEWTFGYPLALLGMIASAALPYVYFRRKGWL
ncbi:magnesium transporter [Tepidamorphus gemmatus]|uniref:Magnesium transport protein CorA n=1 Tax=Tepidamorphus gemmatus TaxID=747076 RepID=A0A4V2UZ38_9HYPH|nr:magnesium transporter CorA family protein [Tepidamorphus gemmatus]TCT09808.1 magnesium transporter [Tepidamorphus gemmatus]